MAKKELIALADYLRDTCGYCHPFTKEQIAHLATFCHASNPRFKRERWLGYIAGECGKNAECHWRRIGRSGGASEAHCAKRVPEH